MSWDDWISWLIFSTPLNGGGDQGERDSWRSHPGRSVVMMLVLIGLLGAVAGVVWLIG